MSEVADPTAGIALVCSVVAVASSLLRLVSVIATDSVRVVISSMQPVYSSQERFLNLYSLAMELHPSFLLKELMYLFE